MQSLLIGALTLSLSASVSSYAAEKEQNKAIIAKGTEDEYIVPPEATQIVESSLPTSIKKNMVQSAQVTPVLDWTADNMSTLTTSNKTQRNHVVNMTPTKYGYAVSWGIGNGGVSIATPGGIGFLTFSDKEGEWETIDAQVDISSSKKNVTRNESALLVNDTGVTVPIFYNSEKYLQNYDVDSGGHIQTELKTVQKPEFPFGSYGIGNSNKMVSETQNLLYADSLYFVYRPSAQGYPKGKVPFFTLNSDQEFTHHFSLDIPDFKDVLEFSSGESIKESDAKIHGSPSFLFTPDDKIHGSVAYEYIEKTSGEERFVRERARLGTYSNQSDIDNNSNIAMRKVEQEYKDPISGGLNFQIVPTIMKALDQDNERFYYTLDGIKDAEEGIEYLGVYEQSTNSSEVAKEMFRLPKGTHLLMTPGIDSSDATTIRFFGSTTGPTYDFKDFEEIPKEGGFVSGVMKKNDKGVWNILSVTGVKADPTIDVSHAYTTSNGSVIGGITGEQDTSVFHPPLEDGINQLATWPKDRTEFGTFSFVGRMGQIEDYSPLIGMDKKQEIVINIDDDEVKQGQIIDTKYGWTALDKWLITGEKNGTPLSSTAIKVYDTYDIKDNLFLGDTEEDRKEWLMAGVNKNPNEQHLPIKERSPIDWEGLNYRIDKPGPHKTTYFVPDSRYTKTNNQVTSTSRFVHNVTNVTQQNNQSVLDAHNFHIMLQDVAAGALDTDNAIKRKAKTIAWEKDTGNIIEEAQEGIFSSDEVVFSNREQLKDIRTATDARPYPLDITYKGSSTVVNRIWVFVTQPNTTIKNNVALYADDFSMPLSDAKTSTSESLLTKQDHKGTNHHLVAYDYVEQPQFIDRLVPLSSAKLDGDTKGLAVDFNSLKQIQEATKPMVLEDILFKYLNPNDQVATEVNVSLTLDDKAEFCFQLERTKDELAVVDPVFDLVEGDIFDRLEIKLPPNVVIKDTVLLPQGWEQINGANEDIIFQFNQNYSESAIRQFLSNIRFTIEKEVDQPGEISIMLSKIETSAPYKEKHKKMTDGLVNSYTSNKDIDWKEVMNPTVQDLYFYVENKSYKVHYGFFNDFNSFQGIPVGIPDVYLTDKTNDAEVNHLYKNKDRATSSSSTFLLGIKTETGDYNTVSSLYSDSKIYTAKDEQGRTMIRTTSHKDVTKGFIQQKATKEKPALTDGKYQVNVELYPLSSSTIRHKFIVTNEGNKALTFVPSKNMDTELNGDDTVPVYMYEENKGLYIQSKKVEDEPMYTLIYSFKHPKAPVNYVNSYNTYSVPILDTQNHQLVSSGTLSREILYRPFEPENVHGVGQEVVGFKPDEPVPIKKGKSETSKDTGILMKWPETTLEPGESEEFVYDVTLVGDMDISYDYQNVTSGTDKHLPGDRIQFDMVGSWKANLEPTDSTFTTKLSPHVLVDLDSKVSVLDADNKVRYDLNMSEVYNAKEHEITVSLVEEEIQRYGSQTSVRFEGILSPYSEGQHIRQFMTLATLDSDQTELIKNEFLEFDVGYLPKRVRIGCQSSIPQKIYIKGKDTEGNPLEKGDQVLDTNIRLNQEVIFKPKAIPTYEYVELQDKDKETLTPEKVTIGKTKQEYIAIYERALGTLHVRQVVLNSQRELVIPEMGEGQLNNVEEKNNSKPILSQIPIRYSVVSKEKDEFDTITFNVSSETPDYHLKPTIPQYYEHVGHLITDKKEDNGLVMEERGKELTDIIWDINEQNEVWVTIFIEPTGDVFSFYSWGYNNE